MDDEQALVLEPALPFTDPLPADAAAGDAALAVELGAVEEDE